MSGNRRSTTVRLPAVTAAFGLLLASFVALTPLAPPTPERDIATTDFSADLAFQHIVELAAEPHPMGSAAIVAVRNGILARLDLLGLEPETQPFSAPDYYGAPGDVEVVNVMARIPGTASTGAVVLMGHYDTVPTTPGANDNTSAVAVILETARAVLAGDPLRNDLILLFTDGEEPAPRYGSTAFVESHPWAEDVAFAVNLEAIGGSGPSLLLETNGPDDWILDHYRAVPHPAAFSFLTTTTELIGGSNTDFAPFRDAGINGIEMAYVRGSPIYHTPADDADSVTIRSLHHHGASTLAIVERLGEEDLNSPKTSGEVVFFPIARWLVIYPAAWNLVLVAATGLMLVVVVRSRWGPVIGRAAIALAAALSGALVSMMGWYVLAGVRDSMGVAESYLYLALLAAVAVVTARRLQSRQVGSSDAAGLITLWWFLGVVLTLAAPGIGAVFVWPAMTGAAAVLVLSPSAGPWLRAIATVLIGAVTLIVTVPAIDVFYQFAQPRPGNQDSEILFIVLIPVLLAVLGLDLIRSIASFEQTGRSEA